MKRIIALIICACMLLCFAACKAKPSSEEEMTKSFESAEKAYEEMTDAAAEGRFGEAVVCYNSGAADVNDTDVVNWYYYSLAMKEYEEHGCLGYPLNLLQYNVDADFQPAKSAMGELQTVCRDLNGAYENDGIYLYILDGKLAVSVGSQLTGTVFCDSELILKDDVFYYALRANDGTHTLLYTLEFVDNGLSVQPTEDNTDDMYSGVYAPIPAEYPELIY